MSKTPTSDYIRISKSLRPRDALKCAKHIHGRGYSDHFYYDFSEMGHCPAFGMLIILNAIRNNIQKYPQAKHDPVRIDEADGGAYAAYMGLFSAIESEGWDVGRTIKADDSGENVIPIKKIMQSDLIEKYSGHTFVIGEMIEHASSELALTLTQSQDSPVNDTLRYCIREIIRNTFEHSSSNSIWICGQHWPSRHHTEIAIMDEGCGILGSLKTNKRYDVSNDMDANKLALQPGVSRMLGRKQDENDPWQNSGYGLFMSSSISILGGHFILSSGTDTTFIDSAHQMNYISATRGTVVCMSLDTDRVESLSDVLRELRNKGEEVSRAIGKNRILTASQVSSIASIAGHIEYGNESPRC